MAQSSLATVNAARLSYFSSCPIRSCSIPSPWDDVQGALLDPEGSVIIEFSSYVQKLQDRILKERLDVDRESAKVLASVVALKNEVGDHLDRAIDGSCLRHLKLEERVVGSDPEVDMIRLHERNILCLPNKGLLPFDLDVEKDESFDWSSKSLHMPARIDREILDERLDIDTQTTRYLKGVVATVNDETSLGIIDCRSMPSHLLRISSPLLPLPPALKVINLKPPDIDVEMTSSPEDPDTTVLAEIDKRVFEYEEVPLTQQTTTGRLEHPTQSRLEQIHSPTPSFMEPSSPPLTCKNKRLRHLRLESPLLPQDVAGSPAKKAKTVTFPAGISSLIPGVDSTPASAEQNVEQKTVTATLTDLLSPLAQRAEEEMRSQQLSEVDTVVKVKVPLVHPPWTSPASPWSQARDSKEEQNAQEEVLARTSQDIIRVDGRWDVTSQSERGLSWSPFPARLGKLKPEADFDDGSLARYLSELELDGENDLRTMTWRPERLQILNSEDFEDEDLEPSVYMEDASIRSGQQHVLRREPPPLQASKQDLPLVSVEPSVPMASVQATAINANFNCPAMDTLLLKRRQQLQGKEPAEGDATGDVKTKSDNNTGGSIPTTTRYTNAVDAFGLGNFMRLQGCAKGLINQADQRTISHAQATAPTAIMAPRRGIESGNDSHPPSRVEWPRPLILQQEATTQVIVCSKVMNSRRLIRALQNLVPDIDLIERDFAALSRGGSVERGVPDLNQDADFTISPSTGLMITSLQKLKQRALPGEEWQFVGIRDRIAQIATRYERLTVLVSEGNDLSIEEHAAVHSLDEGDCDMFTGLVDFASRLAADVRVHYVLGGDTELAEWIAGITSQYAGSSIANNKSLLHEETLWEHLLRRAGLNAFAAQVLLSSLKVSHSLSTGGHSAQGSNPSAMAHGIAAFISMGGKERVQHFGPLLGGHKMVDRVSRALDAGWTPSVVSDARGGPEDAFSST